MKLDIFKYNQSIELLYSTSGFLENSPMRNREALDIHKGVATKIDVNVKNSDKKKYPSAGKTFTAYLINYETQTNVLTKELDEVDASKGQWELTILEGESRDWPAGLYRMAFTIVDENDDEHLLHADLGFGAITDVKVRENVLAPFISSSVSDASTWTELNGKWYSSAYKADGLAGANDGIHTIALSMTNFTGQFWVQSTLEPTAPAQLSQWFDLNLGGANDYLSYTAASDTVGVDFTINASYVRFVYDPDDTNVGTFDQVVYRA